MKRLCIFLVVLLVVFLWGCSPFSTEASEAAYNAIEELRNKQITLDDAEYLTKLEEQYLSLSEEEQGEITNYVLLENARYKLKEAETSVEEINSKLELYKSEFPPEALDALVLAQEQYEQLAEANQQYVDIKNMKRLLKQAETWYGENSLYGQMLKSQKAGDHGDVLVLADKFFNVGAPEAVTRWYGDIVEESILTLAKSSTDDAEMMLSLYTAKRFELLSQEGKVELAEMIVVAFAEYVRPLVEQKKYDDALQIIDDVPFQIINIAKNDSLKQCRGQCYIEKAKKLYDEKKYKEVTEVCLDGIVNKLKITGGQLEELLQVLTDSSLKLADSLIKSGKYSDAYSLLKSAERSEMTGSQKALLQDKKTEMFKKTRPKNGAYLAKGTGAGRGYGRFEVTNERESDAVMEIVKINDSYEQEGERTLVFVAGKSKAKFSFADGKYKVRYCCGTDYLNTDTLFASGNNWQEVGMYFGADMTFETTYSGYTVRFTVNTYTIN